MKKNKVVLTVGALALGVTAVSVIGVAAGQAIVSGAKKRGGAGNKDSRTPHARHPSELSDESKDRISEVVWRESGLTQDR